MKLQYEFPLLTNKSNTVNSVYKGHLYKTNTVYKGQPHFPPLINNAYNCNLLIKGTFAGSLECSLYTGLTVLQLYVSRF